MIAEYIYDEPGQKGLLSKSKAYSSEGATEVRYLSYDARNRLTLKEWVVPGNGGGAFRMAYTYDEANHTTYVQYPANNSGGLGELVRQIYNPVGQLDQVISQADNTHYVASTLYNPEGEAWSQRYDQNSNGASRQFTYYQVPRRLAYLRAGRNGSVTNLQDSIYSYDPIGNVTKLTDHANSSQVQCFQYDYLNRLTEAFTGNSDCTAYSATGAGPYDHDYGYDAIGNLTNYDGAAYTYGSSKPHAVTAAHGNSYGYDGNGNQTSRTIGGTTHTLDHDYENRVTAFKVGGNPLGTFLYDADGNRVKSTFVGIPTVYLGGIYEYKSGASTKYYAGHDGLVAFRREGHTTDNGIFYLLDDHLGSATAVLNQDGTVQTAHYYYPYGGKRTGNFSSLTTKRFTGQYHEAAIPGGEGLYYYNARWYDPKLGRFTQADTLVPEPSNPQDLNRFSYGRNNPVRYSDPSGHVVADPNRYNYVAPIGDLPPPGPLRQPSGPRRFIVDSRTLSYRYYSPITSRNQAWSLVRDWFFEWGSSRQTFGPMNSLTHDVMYDPGMKTFRKEWAQAGYPVPWRWQHTADKREGPFLDRAISGGEVFVREHFIQLGLSTFGYGSRLPEGKTDAVGGIIGSLDRIYVRPAKYDMVRFDVVNTMGWESGSRIPGTNSSFISNKNRNQWGPGGTVIQRFYWYEPAPDQLRVKLE